MRTALPAVLRIRYDYTVHMLTWLALPHLMSRPNALHRPMSNACIKCTLHESSRSTQESSRDIGIPRGLAENSPPAGIPFEHAHTARPCHRDGDLGADGGAEHRAKDPESGINSKHHNGELKQAGCAVASELCGRVSLLGAGSKATACLVRWNRCCCWSR